MDNQVLKSQLKQFIFEFGVQHTSDVPKLENFLPSFQISPSKVQLLHSVIKSTIVKFNQTNSQLSTMIWKQIQKISSDQQSSEVLDNIASEFVELKIYTNDFDDCFSKNLHKITDSHQEITSWEQIYKAVSLASILMVICTNNKSGEITPQATRTSIASIVSYLASSCENFLVKNGILNFLNTVQQSEPRPDSTRTESESSANSAVYIDKNHETTRFVLSSMTTSTATTESWCNVDDLARRNTTTTTTTPTSVSSALASDNEIIPEVMTEQDEDELDYANEKVEDSDNDDETFEDNKLYLRSNISAATIKSNTTSDTLVDKRFSFSRDRMSDTEDDQNEQTPQFSNEQPRPLSNVLQASRTELPTSSARLLTALASHEDMKSMIAAASSNCLIDKMGELPEETQFPNLNNSYDDEDVGVKLRVSRSSTENSSNGLEETTNILPIEYLPGVDEVDTEKIDISENLQNSSDSENDDNSPDNSINESSINNSANNSVNNSSLLTDVTMDITPTTPPLAMYNSGMYHSNNRSVLGNTTMGDTTMGDTTIGDTTLGDTTMGYTTMGDTTNNNTTLNTTYGQPIMNSTADVTDLNPKCSFFNATLPTINNTTLNHNNSSLDSTRTLENDENTPPLDDTLEFTRSGKTDKIDDKTQGQFDLQTAAVLGGAIAGISAFLYLKLK